MGGRRTGVIWSKKFCKLENCNDMFSNSYGVSMKCGNYNGTDPINSILHPLL